MLSSFPSVKHILPSCAVLFCCGALCAATAAADNTPTGKAESPLKLELSPALFSSIEDDQYSLGAKFKVEYDGTKKIDWLGKKGKGGGSDWANRLRYRFNARMAGSVAVEPEANPDPLYLQAQWGVRYQNAELQELGVINDTEALSFFLEGSLMGRMESDQSQDNRVASLGAHFSAVSDNNSGLWGLVPEIGLHFELARDLSSPAARREAAEDQTFRRFRATASRVINLDEYWKEAPPFLKSTKFIFDLRYYKEFERADGWNDQGLDEAWYGAFTFSLGDVFKIPHVSDLFLRLSAGRLPPSLEEVTTLTLGISFY
jgi:hypothetical protein